MFKKFFNEWVVPFIIALMFFLVFNTFIGTSRISGSSMYPTYKDGQITIVNKYFYNKCETPQVNDIIIFNSELENNESLFEDTKKLIKRVIALPGDHVVVSDGNVYINDVLLKEDYLPDGLTTPGEVDIILGDNEFFVMGDNRHNSADSRILGPVHKNTIIGKVIFTLGF